jgi:hypothetical protein
VGGEDDTFTFDFPVLELVGMLGNMDVSSEAGAEGQAGSNSNPSSEPMAQGQVASSSSNSRPKEGEESQGVQSIGGEQQQAGSTGAAAAAAAAGSSTASKSKLSQDIAAAEERSNENLK